MRHPTTEQLSAYLEEDLSPKVTRMVRVHLESCAECRSRLDTLRDMVLTLGQLPDHPAPADTASRVLEGVRRKPGLRELVGDWLDGIPSRLLQAGSVLVVFITVGLVFYHSPEKYREGLREAVVQDAKTIDRIESMPAEEAAKPAPGTVFGFRSEEEIREEAAPAKEKDSAYFFSQEGKDGVERDAIRGQEDRETVQDEVESLLSKSVEDRSVPEAPSTEEPAPGMALGMALQAPPADTAGDEPLPSQDEVSQAEAQAGQKQRYTMPLQQSGLEPQRYVDAARGVTNVATNFLPEPRWRTVELETSKPDAVRQRIEALAGQSGWRLDPEGEPRGEGDALPVVALWVPEDQVETLQERLRVALQEAPRQESQGRARRSDSLVLQPVSGGDLFLDHLQSRGGAVDGVQGLSSDAVQAARDGYVQEASPSVQGGPGYPQSQRAERLVPVRIVLRPLQEPAVPAVGGQRVLTGE